MASDESENLQQQQSPLASQRAKEEKGEKVKLPRNIFPLAYKEAFSQWWAGITPAAAEAEVLSYVPVYSNSLKPATGAQAEKENHTNPPLESTDDRVCASNLVPLTTRPKQHLNEFSVTRPSSSPTQNNLVILHGYGAGLGFFYKNFDALSKRSGWSLYALDMLGMGRSSRPPFKIKATDKIGKIREAESFFVDSLEDWRKSKGLNKFTLMGHSLGGYLAVCYALKYPGRLEKLILASPVGIPVNPYAMEQEMPDQESSVGAKLTQEQTAASANVGTGEQAPKPRRFPGWFHTLWDMNISPFSIVRWTGPLGPRFVSGWTSRRFGALPEAEAQALHMYSYTLFKQKGSGEYALSYLLAPGAFARDPLKYRLNKVDKDLEVVFMYGDVDWMDSKAGRESADEMKRSGGKSRFKIIPNAGHHLYLDNYNDFNKYMDGVLESVEKDKAAPK